MSNKTIPFERSFASYQGKTPNNKLKIDCWCDDNETIPRKVFKSSHKKFKFNCDICNHDFISSLCKISENRWCPYCSNKKICNNEKCNYCYNKSFSSYKGKTLNGKLKIDCWNEDNKSTIRKEFKSSNKKFKFNCDICNHVFTSILGSVSGKKSRWCPYCSNKKLCDMEKCDNCYNKSFASYQEKTLNCNLKINCWSKNNKLTARQVFKSSHKKIKFNCDICDHEFISVLSGVSGRNIWCNYCSNTKICDNEKCNNCYNKSFASYKGKTLNKKLKINCWHKDNKKKPRNIFKSSNKKYKFSCDICYHDFTSGLNHVSGKQNTWCPYCKFQKMCYEKDCNYCYNNSFVSYKGKTINGKLKINCWHDDNKLKPREIPKTRNVKYKFKCDVCIHDFISSLDNICINNTWCSKCKNKTELILYNWLLKIKIIKKVIKEYSPIWCSTEYKKYKNNIKKGKYQYRYDFLIIFNNNKQLIIELDGNQHYKQVSNWKTPFEHQIRDKYKEFKAKSQNIPIIRCIQEDVFMDKNNWDKKLQKQFKKYNK